MFAIGNVFLFTQGYYSFSSETRQEHHKLNSLTHFPCFRCQGSSIVRFLSIDPMVSGSSPTSARI